jgi:Flp pilus assembly protein TadG
MACERRHLPLFCALPRECSGAAAVEFAFILPVLLLFVFGTFEFGRYFWTQNVLQYGVEQTARYAYVHTDLACDQATMEPLVHARVLGLSSASVTVSATIDTNSSATFTAESCKVQATYSFTFLGYLDLGSVTVQGIAEYPCKNTTAKDNSCPTA